MKLLPRHRDPQALLRADQVVHVLGRLVDVELDPVDPPTELAVRGPVVVAHGSRGVASHVGGLVGREDHGYRRLDVALPCLLAVDVERDRAALAEPTAVIGELHPQLVLAGWNGILAVHLELLQPE